jgi:hypothetical protein
MYSVQVTNFDQDIVVVMWDEQGCSGENQYKVVPAGTQECIAVDLPFYSLSITYPD